MGNRQRKLEAKQRQKQKRLYGVTAAGAVAIVALVAAIAMNNSNDKSATATNIGPTVGGDLHSLVADPTHPNRLFVGGHAGVGVSDDGGRNWNQVSTLTNADAMGWAFTDAGIWQGGHPGLHQSANGDLNFVKANVGLPATDVHALGGSGSVLYASSPAAGVFGSTDGGRHWEIRSSTAGRAFMGRILVDPRNDRHLVAPDMSLGAVESVDGGVTWRPMGGPKAAMWVSWIGGDTNRIVVSAESGAQRSDDSGKTWQPLTIPSGASVVEASPSDAQVMWAAALNGTRASIRRSTDEGSTWNKP